MNVREPSSILTIESSLNPWLADVIVNLPSVGTYTALVAVIVELPIESISTAVSYRGSFLIDMPLVVADTNV